MREILFRGKGNPKYNEGNWYEGYLTHDTENYRIYIPFGIKGYYTMTVLEETVGQFTGLTDKNGRKIFEGDIILFGENIYQIIFECGSFALYDKHGEIISKIGGINDHCYPLMNLYLECCWEENLAYDIEIVGNIHDNPELLEQEEWK